MNITPITNLMASKSKVGNVAQKAIIPATLIAGGIAADRFVKTYDTEHEKSTHTKKFYEVLDKKFHKNIFGKIVDKATNREKLEGLMNLNGNTVERILAAKDRFGNQIFSNKGVSALEQLKDLCQPAYNYLLSNVEYVDSLRNKYSSIAEPSSLKVHAKNGETIISMEFKSKGISGGVSDTLKIVEKDSLHNTKTVYTREQGDFGNYTETKKVYDTSRRIAKLIEEESIEGNSIQNQIAFQNEQIKSLEANTIEDESIEKATETIVEV